MNWFRRMMQGRNGADQLGNFLIWTSLILFVIELFLPAGPGGLLVSIAVWALLIFALFRMFSKNIPARRNENQKFCAAVWRLRTTVLAIPKRLRERQQYRHYACPNCGQKVRVPRGAGKIKITCPRCGEKFDRSA